MATFIASYMWVNKHGINCRYRWKCGDRSKTKWGTQGIYEAIHLSAEEDKKQIRIKAGETATES